MFPIERRELALLESGPPARAAGVREFVEAGWRWRKRMAVVFAAAMICAVVAALTMWDYESEMKILVQRGRIDPLVTAGQTRAEIRPDLSEEELNGEIELLRSEDVLRNVVLARGLQKTARGPLWLRLLRPREAESEPVRTAKALRVLAKDLSVSLPKKSGVITVRYRAANPKVAAEVLATLSQLYLQKHTSVHRPPGQFEFFEQQTEVYRGKLAEAEAKLASFGQSGGTVAGTSELDNTVKKLAELNLQYRQALASVEETRKRLASLEQQAVSTPPRMTTAVRTADNPHLMMQLRTTLLNLELRRTELLKKYLPTYREVQELDRQIGDTRTAITEAENSPPRDITTDRDPTYEWIKSELAKVRAELTGYQARADSLRQSMAEAWGEARKLNADRLRQQDLEREAKALEESYQLYTRKREEARISDALDQRKILNVSVVQAPTIPVLPRRSPWIFLLGGTIAAIVMSIGTALASEFAGDSVRGSYSIEESLQLPVLAVLGPETKLLDRGGGVERRDE